LQEKKGFYYIVLTYKDEQNNPKSKWISTKLPVKGNKKKAEAMLLEARKTFEPNPIVTEADILFSDYMLGWLEMVRSNIEVTTYASYSNNVKGKIVPYFSERKIKLKDLQPKHIQEFYTDCMREYGICANTVIRYHANLRKALQYAVKTDLLVKNPADQVDRPKVNKFVGSFYDKDEINRLLAVVRGTKIELAVLLASFYGLRRSEILGLKWNAIDFESKTITIQHIVTQVSVDGTLLLVQKDRTKNKASRRTLPLVPQIEQFLLRLQREQKTHRAVCKSCYTNEYLDYLYVNEMGDLIKPDYVSENFKLTLQKHGLRHIRFHDLRHSCASLLLANGVSMKSIQEWLGHSDFGTTANIYAHLDYSQKLSSASTMSDIIEFR
ncbi:MAG TPA: site-specific integrase, partial [Clostridia bacterium]|nr:site-specific integrase [Clostridia bacterium]